MHLAQFSNYEEMSLAAFQLVSELIEAKPESHLILPTGSSPTGLYRLMRDLDLSGCYFTKLDEFLDMPEGHPQSCEGYLVEHVLTKWKLNKERYLSFDPLTSDPEAECLRIDQALTNRPPVDMCILGIGANGHIGLNEPAEELTNGVHVAKLSKQTVFDGHFANLDQEPTRGITSGVGTIMAAKTVLLLVSGDHKADAYRQLKQGNITTQLPASLLHLHPSCHCLSCI